MSPRVFLCLIKIAVNALIFKFSLNEISVLFEVLNTLILKSERFDCQKEVGKKISVVTLLLLLDSKATSLDAKTVLSFFSPGAIDWCASNSVMEKSGECEVGRVTDKPGKRR